MTFRCIRHRLLGFVASGTVILFLHVFFDYTGGDDISLHPARLFSSCMSFLTTQEGMTFCCLCEKNWSCWLRKELVVFAKRGDDILLHEYYSGNTFGIPSDVPMMCTVHHVGSTWHKKWIFEERHASHSSILDLYVWFTRCIFWNAYNDMKMMVYWGESMQKNRECLVHESYTRTELT